MSVRLCVFLQPAQSTIEELKYLQRHQETYEQYTEVLHALDMQANPPRDFESLRGIHNALIGFLSELKSLEATDFFKKMVEAFRERKEDLSHQTQVRIQWDDILIDMLREYRGHAIQGTVAVPSKERLDLLGQFARNTGWEIIWPEPGDAFSMEEHQVLKEEVQESVEAGRVAYAMAPGLRRRGRVELKAGVCLARRE